MLFASCVQLILIKSNIVVPCSLWMIGIKTYLDHVDPYHLGTIFVGFLMVIPCWDLYDGVHAAGGYQAITLVLFDFATVYDLLLLLIVQIRADPSCPPTTDRGRQEFLSPLRVLVVSCPATQIWQVYLPDSPFRIISSVTTVLKISLPWHMFCYCFFVVTPVLPEIFRFCKMVNSVQGEIDGDEQEELVQPIFFVKIKLLMPGLVLITRVPT